MEAERKEAEKQAKAEAARKEAEAARKEAEKQAKIEA